MKTKKSPRPGRPASLAAVQDQVIRCERCPRLRAYCQDVARVKRAAYRSWTYWGRPVPGFGDPNARVLILGLAPAAHGANRTGRVFTGDGHGASGDFLFSALKRAGLANRDTSERPDDGLELTGVYIAAAVRCAPPDNKPTPAEVTTCLDHLEDELLHLPEVDTVVTLGKIAWDAWLQLVARHVILPRPRPAFRHGVVVNLAGLPVAESKKEATGDVTERRQTLGRIPPRLVGCYHPSRQNTQTGMLTADMYDAMFQSLPIARRRDAD